MRVVAKIVRDDEKWTKEVARELTAYLPIICGARMIRDYLRFLFKTNN